jgi:hypothetical protein
MPIDIQRPVFLSGENPGMTLYKPGTDQPVAILSYWHVTDSPHGTGNALVLWLDQAGDADFHLASSGIYTNNLSLAHTLMQTLTQHFPEFRNVPAASLPYREAHCEHVFNSDGRYIVTCHSEAKKIVVEWAKPLDRRSISWPGFPAGDQLFDLRNVLCPCGSGMLTINGMTIDGEVKTAVRTDGYPSSTAFLAFAESWIGPMNHYNASEAA